MLLCDAESHAEDYTQSSYGLCLTVVPTVEFSVAAGREAGRSALFRGQRLGECHEVKTERAAGQKSGDNSGIEETSGEN